MPSFVLVDDPTYEGKGTPPQTLRSWAMRELYKRGMEIGDIARKYDVPYARAYRAINPERKEKTQKQVSTDIRKVSTSRLVKIATAKGASLQDPRVAAAVAELDRRDPGWFEK